MNILEKMNATNNMQILEENLNLQKKSNNFFSQPSHQT